MIFNKGDRVWIAGDLRRFAVVFQVGSEVLVSYEKPAPPDEARRAKTILKHEVFSAGDLLMDMSPAA